MNRCYQPRGAATFAAASVAASVLSCCPSTNSPPTQNHAHLDVSTQQSRRGESNQIAATRAQLSLHLSALSSWTSNPFIQSVLSTKCEEAADAMPNYNKSATNSAATTTDSRETPMPKIDYYYVKMDPNDLERTSLLDSHAVFGALWGEGMVERFNLYRHTRVNRGNEQQESRSSKRELVVVDLKLGDRLNGHGGIVHGGIISLLFDEAMGWAYECLEEQDGENYSSAVTAVTANLTVDFRAPLLEGSEAVIRVYHNETQGRKIYFSAALESKDGNVVFAEAKSLFILVRSDRMTSS
ncbi:hypothetical protein ACHAXR_010731 [Thalassiosira sp. AJA248-18]